MTELMFVLTTVFVAYVVYSIAQQKQAMDQAATAEDAAVVKAELDTPSASASVVVPPPAPVVAPAKPAARVARSPARPAAPAKPEIQADKPVTPAVASVAVAATSANKASVRDPKTGEVASVAGNYRFMKRWIKEALVAEGLLTHVYKNNELDEAAETKIKQALAALQEMDGYRA